MTKKAKKAAVKKTGPSKGLVYLTTQALQRAVSAGTKNEKTEAFELLGYTVKEKNGWVVKEYEDGTIERIVEINSSQSLHFALD